MKRHIQYIAKSIMIKETMKRTVMVAKAEMGTVPERR